MTTRSHPYIASALCMLMASTPGFAVDMARSNAEHSLLELSLDELMQVTVTSVSKKAQRLDETAAAVFVINADDIRRAGATNVPEALRLAPGVQVAAMGHNKWSVSIRGFNTRFANKLLVLVDGRAIYSPAFSGVFWEHNDIPLENIERIEVIRGPGGSIWGANAVNGVINIITRSAKDTEGGQLSVAAGNELRGAAFARYGWTLDEDTHVRLHAQAKSVDAGQAIGGGDGADDWNNRQAGFRLDASRGKDSYSLQGSIAQYKAGDFLTAFEVEPAIDADSIAYTDFLRTDGDGKTAHLLGRWERETDTGAHSLQAYLDHSDHEIGLFRYRNNTFDLEYQQQITRDKHDIIWGLGYRISHDQTTDRPYVRMADTSKTFSLYSAFIQDEITLAPNQWRLTLGGRFEHNDFTGFEFQPNIRLLWTPTPSDSLWAAASRAVRTPSRGETASTAFISAPMPPFVPFPMAAVGDPAMDSEKLQALDLGWRRQWSPSLTSEVAAFYYRHSDLRGAIPDFPPVQFYENNLAYPYLPMTLTNAAGAESYGLEAAVDWLPRPDWRLQLNASLFEINARDPVAGVSAFEFVGTTPTHQLSLRSSFDITPRLQWDVWLRHVGKLGGGPTGYDTIPAYTSMDMRLAWKPRRDLQISLVGQNLLDAAHPEKIMTNVFSQRVEIERGVYVKVDWKF
jgi:iron complex outermembrane receptor protein